MNNVAKERTNWRDQEISNRHRMWGFNCPAVDLDFLMVEYNHGKAVALVEYKHVRAAEPNIRGANYRALIDLANGYAPGALPCFIAFYDPPLFRMRIITLNAAAYHHFHHVENQWISEQRYVRGLHLLRKQMLFREDEDAISSLNSETSPCICPAKTEWTW